jgi:SagB-type dehydrogenase family enzyme
VRAPLGALGPGLSRALALLAGDDPVGEDDIRAAAAEAEGIAAVLKVKTLLERLDRGGWLERVVVAGERPLLGVRPLGHDLGGPPPAPPVDAPVVLSRYAHVRPLDGGLVVETPRRAVRVVVGDAAVLGVLAAVAAPTAASALAVDGLDRGELDAVVAALVRAGLVVAAGEESSQTFAQWSFADLLFHQRSRIGRHIGGYGGSFPFEGRFAPLGAVREHPGPEIALHAPDLAAIDEPRLTDVLESRVSVRRHDDDRPLTVARLGEFLYRCARNRAVFTDGHEEAVSRPYPAGGALHELELYPLVHNVAGLAPGLYHYDPQGHTLGLVSPPGPPVQLLLEYGRRTAVMDTPPQVVLLISARFGRMMWKYESMAYAATLKHVGVLYQTMYLVATAMGLAPCALGGGNADGFAAAAGTDPYVESSVGEFVLGSRPRPEAAVAQADAGGASASLA